MNGDDAGVESYCTARDARALISTPALPLQNCRDCWRCGGEFTDETTGERYVGCMGKGRRHLDGREGQFCTIFSPRWNRTAADVERARRQNWQLVGPNERARGRT